MARRMMNASDFIELVQDAEKQQKDCVWVSQQMASKGFSTKPNSIYQRINKLNNQCEDQGIEPFLPQLKEDATKSAGGVGGKKLNLAELAKKFAK